MSAAVPGARAVHFRGVPARLVLAHLAHLHDLLHELRIVRVGQDTGQVPVGEELAKLVEQVSAILDAYGGLVDASRAEAEEALKVGRERVDLMFELSPEVVGVAQELQELLERADVLCREEQLLTLEAPPDIQALRRWQLEELERQLIAHQPPSPCPL